MYTFKVLFSDKSTATLIGAFASEYRAFNKAMGQARNVDGCCMIIMQKIVNGRRIPLYSTISFNRQVNYPKTHKY